MGFDNNRVTKAKAPVKKRTHVYEGFPHYSSTFPYHCMCLDTCCHNEAGCKCAGCACKYGIEHGTKDYAGAFQGKEESEIRSEQSEVREIRSQSPADKEQSTA